MAVAGKNDIRVDVLVGLGGLINLIEHDKIGKILFEVAAAVFGFHDIVGVGADGVHLVL